jgi:hypothetical protein
LRRLEASHRLLFSQQVAPYVDAGHLIDAATSSFVASIGIWAAVVRRHWFLRFLAVCGVLALGLLVPAYEIVIEFAIQVAVISAGVAVWQGAKFRRPRMSLETALLAMVVAAVAAAVVGAAPDFTWDTWVRIVFLGLTLGGISLLSLWIACGRSSLWMRLVFGAIGLVVFIAIFYFGIALRDTYYASQRGSHWWSYLVHHYQPDILKGWLKQAAPGIVLGVVTFTSLLTLARGSGWFTEQNETDARAPSAPLIRTMSRGMLCAAFGVIATANLYLIYRLCTPPAYLPEHVPADNGFDDFLAAGTLPGIDFHTIRSQPAQDWSDADLSRLVGEVEPVLARLDAGLAKSSWVPCAYADDATCQPPLEANYNLFAALHLQIEQLRRQGRWHEYAARCVVGLRFAQESSRGHRWNYDAEPSFTWTFAQELNDALGALTPDECRRIAADILRIDQAREPVTRKVNRYEISLKRLSWQKHLRLLADEWNDSKSRDEQLAIDTELGTQARLRVLAVQAALQAYWRTHGTLPPDLQSLVPRELSRDLSEACLDGHVTYSVDRGLYHLNYHAAIDEAPLAMGFDDAPLGPSLPPVPYRWKQIAAEYFARGWAALKAVSNSAATAPPPTTPR